ncbi:MAG: Zn-dependent exopeptidase M28 [Solirubrobacterales bacterium]|nr:Zn-dependent exopeptidase M28 [Solirubrobacterales bacterium]
MLSQGVPFFGKEVAGDCPPRSACAAARAAAPSSSSLPRARTDRFDAARALRLVDLQLAFGQRPAGSRALRRTAERLKRELPRGRFENVPGHPGLRNIVGVLPGRRPALVIGAHYDTESHPEGFVGANDSAAGSAAVIEIARAMGRTRRPAGARELRFVLFDGEEEPREEDNDDFFANALRGSKAYVKAHAERTHALVLLDYIANKGLELPREGSSDPGLWRQLRAAAGRVGVGRVFPDTEQTAIFDDHTPFLNAGIPAIDLIDFSYEHADSLEDTRDKLDPRAIDAVGESVVELLRARDRARR